MKDTVVLKLRVAAVVVALLLIFLMAAKVYAEPTPPAVLKEPPTITIVDWCAGPAIYASGLVMSIREGYTKNQVTQLMVDQMTAIKEQTGQVMPPDQLITMIGILDKAFKIPKDEMMDLYGGARFVQEVADECAKKLEKLNEEAEKGLTI
jgi:hypothetical protein